MFQCTNISRFEVEIHLLILTLVFIVVSFWSSHHVLTWLFSILSINSLTTSSSPWLGLSSTLVHHRSDWRGWRLARLCVMSQLISTPETLFFLVTVDTGMSANWNKGHAACRSHLVRLPLNKLSFLQKPSSLDIPALPRLSCGELHGSERPGVRCQSVSACAQKPLYLLPLAECQAANCTGRATCVPFCDAINSKSVIQSLKIWEFSKFMIINQLQTLYIIDCSGLLLFLPGSSLLSSISLYPVNTVRTAGCPADCGQRLWKYEEGKSLNVTCITGYQRQDVARHPPMVCNEGPRL